MSETPLIQSESPDQTGVRQPKQDRSKRSLEKLLRAAEELIARHGVEALTLASLLKSAGLSNGAFYARFPSKDAVVQAVQHQALMRLEQAVEQDCSALEQAGLPLAPLVAGITASLARQFHDRAGLFAALMKQTINDPAMQLRAAETHQRVESLLRRVLLPVLLPAPLGQDGCQAKAERQITMVHHVLFAVFAERVAGEQYAASKHGESWQELQDELSDLLLRYLQPESPAAAVTIALDAAYQLPAAPAAESAPARRLSRYSQGKVESILSAARSLFMEAGYGATSMDQVAARAGVGKATVYAHFTRKSELFAAVVASEAQLQIRILDTQPGDDLAPVLEAFGRQALDLLLGTGTISKLRMIAAEAGRFPELGAVFYTAGPARLLAALAAFLGDAMGRGILRPETPLLAATEFIALISGDLQIRKLVGCPDDTILPLHETVLRSGVATFLRAYRSE